MDPRIHAEMSALSLQRWLLARAWFFWWFTRWLGYAFALVAQSGVETGRMAPCCGGGGGRLFYEVLV
jgi:hypothetical protein